MSDLHPQSALKLQAPWRHAANVVLHDTNDLTHPVSALMVGTAGDLKVITAGGETITIYRDGELYTSYPAQNIDLLNNEENYAIFGLRHIGGNGSISGAIDDARIYDRALSGAEVKSLKERRGQDYAGLSPLPGTDLDGTVCSMAETFWHQSQYVVLCEENDYPRALSASVLAARLKAPLLYFDEVDGLSTGALATVGGLDPTLALLVGLPALRHRCLWSRPGLSQVSGEPQIACPGTGARQHRVALGD